MKERAFCTKMYPPPDGIGGLLLREQLSDQGGSFVDGAKVKEFGADSISFHVAVITNGVLNTIKQPLPHLPKLLREQTPCTLAGGFPVSTLERQEPWREP